MDLRISPLLAPTHTGLPPAFFQVMEQDPLRDDGLVYEKVLREASVKTKLVRCAFTMIISSSRTLALTHRL